MILLIGRSRAPGKGSERLGSVEVGLHTHLPVHSSANNLPGSVPQFPTGKPRMTFPQRKAVVRINIHPRLCGIQIEGDVEWKTQILPDSSEGEGGSNGT